MTRPGIPVALVTGASSGIGREMARVLCARGLAVVATGRNEGELEALRGELAPVRVWVVAADLSLPGGCELLRNFIEREKLAVRVLVNNAGFGELAPFIDSGLSRQLDMIRVNVAALVELTHDFAPQMAASGEGFILNVASTAGFAPGGLMSVYYATKAFVISFSLALAEELAPAGVRVCTLCPGPTRTGFDRAAGVTERAASQGSMDPRRVARLGIDALFSGKRLVVPGALNKLAVLASRVLPRSALSRYLFAFNARKVRPPAR